MKLAEFKRLPAGTKLWLVHCLLGPVPAEKQARTIERSQSNAHVMHTADGKTSWCYFPAARNFSSDPAGFITITEDGEDGSPPTLACQYRFDPPAV